MNRVEFATSIGTQLWPKYEQILRAIDEGANKVSIRSCNGAGKTKLLATLFAYEFARRKALNEKLLSENPNAELPSLKVICTAATATQLQNALWAENAKTCKQANIPMKRVAKRFELIEEKQFAVAINPAKVESAQGYHADRVVIFIDEASGFTHGMIQALMSNATGEDYLIAMTYNPLETESPVYDLEEAGNSDWAKFSISAFEHPNVTEGVEIIRGAVTREFISVQLQNWSMPCLPDQPNAIHTPWDNEHKWWMPTPEALARICGEWSMATQHGLIPMTEILACCKDDVESRGGMRVLGADIAAKGEDKTVLSIFYGNEQIEYRSFQTGEYGVIASQIVQTVKEHGIELIAIDDTGIGNAVTDRLKDYKDLAAVVIPVNFSQKPKGLFPLRHPANARAEMYINLETEVRRKEVKLFYKPDALKEIAAPRIVPLKNGDVRLEDKVMIARRLGRSPDHADATALARYGVRLLKYFNQERLLF